MLFVLAARCPRAVDVSVVELTEIFREKWQTNANVCTEKKNEDWPPTIKKLIDRFGDRVWITVTGSYICVIHSGPQPCARISQPFSSDKWWLHPRMCIRSILDVYPLVYIIRSI